MCIANVLTSVYISICIELFYFIVCPQPLHCAKVVSDATNAVRMLLNSTMCTAGLDAVIAADEEQAEKTVNSPDSGHADEIAPTTPNRANASSKAADLAFNHAVITALASQMASNQAADAAKALAQAEELILAADSFQHARHVLLLALQQACYMAPEPSAAAVTILKGAGALWTDVQGSAAITGPTPAAVADEQGIPIAAHYKSWDKKAAKSHAAVLQQALLVGLQHASSEKLQALPGQLVCSCL